MMDNISPYFFPEQLADGFLPPPPFLPPPIKQELGSFMPPCSTMNHHHQVPFQPGNKPYESHITLLANVKTEPVDNYFPSMPPCPTQPTTCTSQSTLNNIVVKTELPDEATSAATKKKSSSNRQKKATDKKIKQEKITDHMTVRKKHDRFNGMPEEEVMLRTLPDHLKPNLDIVIVGINPGLFAAYVGHHYAGPGNHFWKCLFMSGLTPEQMNAYDDVKLLDHGIGFTNIVQRTSKGSSDLTRKEIKEGAQILIEKLRYYKPKIAAFNGKGIYEIFWGNKNFHIGKQPDCLEGTETVVFVMPSSSARCSQLPRAIDKVPFYTALKKLRDYLLGDLKSVDESEICFPDLELKVKVKEDPDKIKEEPGEYKSETTTSTKKRRSGPKKEPPSEGLPDCGFASTSSMSAFSAVTSSYSASSCPNATAFTGLKSIVKDEKPYNMNDYGMMPPPVGNCPSNLHMPPLHMPMYHPNMYFQPHPSSGCPPMTAMPPLPGFAPLLTEHGSLLSYPPSNYPLGPLPFAPVSGAANFIPNPMFSMVKQEPLTFGYEQHLNY